LLLIRLLVEIANNGGATAGTVRGTLTSTSPFVTVVEGSADYPALGPGTSATNRTAFSFLLAADTPCGAKVPFTLSVSFSGRGTSPTVFNFTVLTGRPGSGAITVSYDGAPVAIPDADAAGVDVPLVVSAVGEISRLVFRVDGATCTSVESATSVGVDHTWVGDLTFRLTSPSGTTVTLINQAGGAGNSGNNFCQTAIDDNATESIQNVSVSDAPFTGTFKPANPEAPFAGENADGTWLLNVSDNAGADTGSLRAFSLDLGGVDCTKGD
jgi:subtilisin-like proprotein convertase family protein